jgi:hypothetical protein
MCRVKELKLSYDCLTGYAIRDRLRNLKKTDPEFWKELTSASVPEPTNTDQTFEEDNVDGPDMFFDDDSDLPCNTIIGCMTGSVIPANVSSTADGDLVSAAQAELMDGDDDSETANAVPVVEEAFGPGKRKRRANMLYKTDMFWRHHDNDDPNDDLNDDPGARGQNV